MSGDRFYNPRDQERNAALVVTFRNPGAGNKNKMRSAATGVSRKGETDLSR